MVYRRGPKSFCREAHRTKQAGEGAGQIWQERNRSYMG